MAPTLLALLIPVTGLNPAAPPTAAQLRFFETRIRPLLSEHCFGCHGPAKQKSGLRLDTVKGVQKGGESERPLIVAAEPEKSLLLQVIRHADGVPAMPPKSRLTDAQLADLAAWVKAGAPFPAEPDKTAVNPENHWAFRPPAKIELPTVQHADWPRTVMDRFILAGLEAKGLVPSLPAEKRLLLRRVTYDLTGLPPTPAETDAFLADASPDAFDKVVERLLASSAYGEKWGRHWLDVVRYADSNGLDENIAHGNAWRYRDYVIASLNADVPFDRFLREQLAGDLLPARDDADRHRLWIATGFLSLGPKVLAEPDPKKMEMDLVDEQVDTLGRAVMGLTLGCARCHDHKFDPVSAEDYYGLAGVFQSTRTMEHFKKIAKWHEHPLATAAEKSRRAEADKRVQAQKDAIKKVVDRAAADVRKAAKKDDKLPASLEPLFPDAVKAELKTLRAELAEREKAVPELPSAMGVAEGDVVEAKVLKRGSHLHPAAAVPRRFPEVLTKVLPAAAVPGKASGRLELAQWLTDPQHPLTARVIVNRVWRWHFGQGLVSSVDNFGLLGEPPSHPALLDWLTRHFTDNGWSLKALHRTIVLSATYQQSSRPVAKALKSDPANRLLWRFTPRRLEAEELRDSVLFVAGSLDRKAGGPALTHVKNREFLFDHTSTDKTTYDCPRRSVYLPVVRNNLYDVFQLFDAPDAAVINGDRATTTVATQSLFLLNGPLVMDAADRVGADVAKIRGDDGAKVRALFRAVLGRHPGDRDLDRVTAALRRFRADHDTEGQDSQKRDRRAWRLLAHVLIATNEFAYVH